MATTLIQGLTRGLRFDIKCESVPHGVRDALASLDCPATAPNTPPSVEFALRRSGSDETRWALEIDGEERFAQPAISEVLDALFFFLNQRVIAHDTSVLSVHAAGLLIDDKGVLLPGVSGAGKSTLCARLLQAGCSYLSDESIGVAGDGELLGYGKPLGLEWRSVTLMHDIDLRGLHLDPRAQSVWHVPIRRFGSDVVPAAPASMIVFPRFQPGAAFHSERVQRSEALMGLLSNSQNIAAVGTEQAMRLGAELVARTDSYRIVYGDARDAAANLLSAVPMTGLSSGPWHLVRASANSGRIRPHPAPEVVAACFDDGALLMHAGNGAMATIDHIGAAVWPRLGDAPLERILEPFHVRFDASPERITVDVEAWLEELRVTGFVV